MTIETLIWLIPVPPLLAFFLIWLFTNRNKALSHSVAVGAALLSFIGSMAVFWQAVNHHELGKEPFQSAVNWLPVADGWFRVGVLVDPLSAVTLFFVAWTVLMIFIYSIGYHNFGQPKGEHDQPGLPPHGAKIADSHGHLHTVPSVEPMYSRFFAFIALFAFGMYLLVVSDNLLTMFMGWEVMGLCSYLLIGFWYAKPSARAAAIKAFMTTRVGDVFMLLGIVYLYSATGTLNFRAILYNQDVLNQLAGASSGFLGLSVAGAISLLLFVGTVGKSAQFPLHVWLPDAMEGPTPVSAMIHAATMVSAGVYAMIRMFPLHTAGWEGHGLTASMSVIAFIGVFTALFASIIAVSQNDIKRVLAYSTIAQLGYMVAALGMGAYVAAAFHLVTHAFFKALLFLGSGSVIHGMEHGVMHTEEHIDPQDMFNMGGLKDKMPFTFWTFLIGGLSLSGFVVVTAGFWSKDEILARAWGGEHLVIFSVLVLSALLTAFYTMRQISLTFLGKPRTTAAAHAQETPWTMTMPLVVLAFFSVTAGWSGISPHFPLLGGILPNWFHEFIRETLMKLPEPMETSYIPLIASIVVSLGGLSLGWLVYHNHPAGAPDPLKTSLGVFYRWMQNKFYFDEVYQFLFVRPSFWFSETFVFKWIDRTVIDGFLHSFAIASDFIGRFLRTRFDLPVINGFGDLVGESSKKFGKSMRVIQTGQVQQYMVAALIFVFGTLIFYLYSLP
ncbi:MAG: NADH-quinone oxidoreductase subunit L [Chloroflexota bacterium]|jgi:NADH-quinone oxidoreductase subunit L